MKLFVDTANLKDIEEALKRGFVRGITTNPSLLAKEPKTEFKKHIGKIVELIKKYQPEAHLSVEVFSRDPDEILKQAKSFVETFAHHQLSIKIQIGWDELEVIHRLSKEGISVNCTCNMSVPQAIMAAAAGAKYVSLFWGRIKDGGLKEDSFNKGKREEMIGEGIVLIEDFFPSNVVKKTRAIFNQSYPDSEIIIGSIREGKDIVEAGLAGAHIVTVPSKFFPGMISHFKTDEVISQFLKDFENWLK